MPSKPKKASLNLPPRKRNCFTERDLARALRAVQKTGGGFRIQIDRVTGDLQLIPQAPQDNNSAANPWDEVLTNAADENRTA